MQNVPARSSLPNYLDDQLSINWSTAFPIICFVLFGMDFSKVLISHLGLLLLFSLCLIQGTSAARSNLFREYIGAEFNNVKFSDLPIHSDVDFHFILSFAIDYDTSSSPSPTDGNFNVFWDTGNLSPDDVQAIKNQHPNVKVSLSLGGDSIGDNNQYVYFQPSSVDLWVSDAVSSLTKIIQQYNLDGIDIDYEHFHASPDIFSQCIGRLISTLKKNGVISFASIEMDCHFIRESQELVTHHLLPKISWAIFSPKLWELISFTISLAKWVFHSSTLHIEGTCYNLLQSQYVTINQLRCICFGIYLLAL